MAMENFSFCFRELGIKEKLSIEKGENNWREVTKGAHLIRCASPIRGTAYEVIRRKNNVSEMFSAMLMAQIKEKRIGRVFVDGHYGMVVETIVPEEDFAEVVQIAAICALDFYDLLNG